MPNIQGEPAESPYMENVEITSKGAVVTSPGFELVSAGAGANGCKNLISYEKDASTRYLVVTTDDDHFAINPASSTWAAVGDYGTAADNVGGVVYKGTTGTRRLIIGDNQVNNINKWDGTTFANLGGSPPKGWIMESWMGMLFIASGSSVYYSAVDTEDNWTGGVIGFDDTVTGLKAGANVLVNVPSITAGTLIGGSRVSADNTLQITFGNLTSGALTPASGTYNIIMFES